MKKRNRSTSNFLLIIAGLVFAPSLFGADMIYSWGYGDILQSTLTAVKFTFAHNDYQGLFKFALLIALTMATIATARFGLKGDLYSLPKIFLMSTGVSALFISATINTVAYDVNTKQNYVIDNVPWAVGKPLVWFTGMEKHLGELLETTFAVPSDISYSNGGFLTPFALMNGMGQAKIIDPYLFQSVDNFLIDCVMPDIATGYINPQVLAQSENLWLEFSNTNPARVTMYYDQFNTHGTVVSCTDAYGTIGGALSTYTNGVGMQTLGKMLGGYSAAQLSSALGTTSNFLMGYSQSSSSLLLQSIMLNQFTNTYSNWAAMNGMDSASVAYGTGKGQQTAEANMVISGALGSKYLPVIKGVLTVIVVALTPAVALLLLTPLFGKVLTGYLVTMIWLSLWHIGEVILNFIVLTKANSYITGVSSSNGIYTMVTKPVVDASTMDYVNMASSMYWMIPTIAGLIVGGFSYMAFQSMTGGMTARVARGEMAATEVGSGSASIGNVSHNNYSANKTDATSSFSGGRHYAMSNDFDEKYGSSSRNANTGLGASMRFNNSNYDINGEWMIGQNGDKIFAKGFSGTDGHGNNISGAAGSILHSDGTISSKTLDVMDAARGVTSTSTIANGKNLSSTTLDKDGVTVNTETREDGGQFVKYKGAGGEFNTANGTQIIGTTGTQISISDTQAMQMKQEESEKIAKFLSTGVGYSEKGSQQYKQTVQAAYDTVFSTGHEGNTAIKQMKNKVIESAINEAYGQNEAYATGAQKTFGKERSMSDEEIGQIKAGLGLELSKGLGPINGKIGAGYEHAWATKDGVVVKTGDNDYRKYEYSEQFKNDLMNKFGDQMSSGKETYFSTKTSDSASSKISASGSKDTTQEYALTKEEKEQLNKELARAYSESHVATVTVEDKQILQNKLLNDFVDNAYKDSKVYTADMVKAHGPGKEGVIKALASGTETELWEKARAFMNDSANIHVPAHVLDSHDRATVDNIDPNVSGVRGNATMAGYSADGVPTSPSIQMQQHIVASANQNPGKATNPNSDNFDQKITTEQNRLYASMDGSTGGNGDSANNEVALNLQSASGQSGNVTKNDMKNSNGADPILERHTIDQSSIFVPEKAIEGVVNMAGTKNSAFTHSTPNHAQHINNVHSADEAKKNHTNKLPTKEEFIRK